MSGLGARVATALVLAPLVIAGVLFLSTDSLRWIVFLLSLLAVSEWARLSGLKGNWPLAAYYLATAGYLLVLGAGEAYGGAFLLSLPVAVFWVLLTLTLMLRRNRPVNHGGGKTSPMLLIAGPLLIGVSGVSLLGLHRMDPKVALFLLFLVWIADSAAYFTGRAFGRRRLAPAISPGKTVEGVLGALVAVAAVGVVFIYFVGDKMGLKLAVFLLLCLGVTLVSVTGDLFESLVKRRQGVKDSGDLLPGHGGVLDRIDSLIAATPVFFTGYYLMESL